MSLMYDMEEDNSTAFFLRRGENTRPIVRGKRLKTIDIPLRT